MRSYQFVLVLSGVDISDDDIADKLFGAGCDDALLNFSHGAVYLDFDRESQDFQTAVLSAIKNVESAGFGAEVLSVNPQDLVSLSEIASRTGLTKQAVSLYEKAKRGPGGFPAPLLNIDERSPLWRWCDVVGWFEAIGRVDREDVDQAIFLHDINLMLELRRSSVDSTLVKLFSKGSGLFV